MSKPTHILVPIEDLKKIQSNPYDWEPEMVSAAVDGLLLISPKVDLSEEGIREKTEKACTHPNDGSYANYGAAYYSQALKDLLNTK